MGGHAADDMRIVRDAGSTGIPGPAVGFGGGAGGEIGLEEGMQTIGRIVGHLLEADATGGGPAILDRGGAPPSPTWTAPPMSILPCWLDPRPPVRGSFLLRQTISVSSASTRPARGLRSPATMLRRSLAHNSQADL